MKNITIFLIIAISPFLFSASCQKKKLLDPNAMIAFNYKASTANPANPLHLSAEEIVRQADAMQFYTPTNNFANDVVRGFSDGQRDFVNTRLLMFGTDIINTHGEFVTEFIGGRDFVLARDIDESITSTIYDTIAYVPNSVLRSAETKIKKAFDEKNYMECYKIWERDVYYTPITGEEWRALKAAGNQ